MAKKSITCVDCTYKGKCQFVNTSFTSESQKELDKIDSRLAGTSLSKDRRDRLLEDRKVWKTRYDQEFEAFRDRCYSRGGGNPDTQYD